MAMAMAMASSTAIVACVSFFKLLKLDCVWLESFAESKDVATGEVRGLIRAENSGTGYGACFGR
jgi:hypothetical protein